MDSLFMTDAERRKVLEDIIANEEVLGAKKSEVAIHKGVEFDTYTWELPAVTVVLKRTRFFQEDGSQEDATKVYDLKVTDNKNNIMYVGNESGLKQLQEMNAKGDVRDLKGFYSEAHPLMKAHEIIYTLLFHYLRNNIPTDKPGSKALNLGEQTYLRGQLVNQSRAGNEDGP